MSDTLRHGSKQIIYVQISLFKMQIFTSVTKICNQNSKIQVGNGQYISVLFIIPIVIDIHGHKFKIVTLVLEIHENVDLVLGIKNIFELEDLINSQSYAIVF